MIKGITIDGFRGIDHIEIEANTINVFVGRNDVGKSSILEAIALTLSAPNKYRDTLSGNILLYSLDKVHYNYLIRYGRGYSRTTVELGNGTRYSIHIVRTEYLERIDSVVRDSIHNLLDQIASDIYREAIDYYTNIISNDLREKVEEIRRNKEGIVGEIKKYILDNAELLIVSEINGEPFNLVPIPYRDIIIHGLTFTPYSFMDDEEFMETANYPCRTRVFEPSDHSDRWREYIIPVVTRFHGLHNLDYMISGLDPLKLEYLVDKLRKVLPGIWDVRVKGEKVYIIRRVDNDYMVMPLNCLGYGYKAFIESIVFSVLGAKVIIVEEPEVFMHPGLIDRYARELIDLVGKAGVSYFASTHSLEFIRFLLDHAGENNMLDSITIFRVYRIEDNVIDIEPISGCEAHEYVEKIKHDLRGI